jgi:hypothetical protein
VVEDTDSDQDYYGTLYRNFASPSDSVVEIRRLQIESIVGVLDELKGDIVNVNDDEELDRIHATIDRVTRDLREEIDQGNDDDDDDPSDPGTFGRSIVNESVDIRTTHVSDSRIRNNEQSSDG